MYKGESAKYTINLLDENESLIDPNSIDKIEVIIYEEQSLDIVIERLYDSNDLPSSNIELDTDSFKFVINKSDTINLIVGNYRINIHITVDDTDFDDSLFHNIEDSILFEIVPTIQK